MRRPGIRTISYGLQTETARNKDIERFRHAVDTPLAEYKQSLLMRSFARLVCKLSVYVLYLIILLISHRGTTTFSSQTITFNMFIDK